MGEEVQRIELHETHMWTHTGWKWLSLNFRFGEIQWRATVSLKEIEFRRDSKGLKKALSYQSKRAGNLKRVHLIYLEKQQLGLSTSISFHNHFLSLNPAALHLEIQWLSCFESFSYLLAEWYQIAHLQNGDLAQRVWWRIKEIYCMLSI